VEGAIGLNSQPKTEIWAFSYIYIYIYQWMTGCRVHRVWKFDYSNAWAYFTVHLLGHFVFGLANVHIFSCHRIYDFIQNLTLDTLPRKTLAASPSLPPSTAVALYFSSQNSHYRSPLLPTFYVYRYIKHFFSINLM